MSVTSILSLSRNVYYPPRTNKLHLHLFLVHNYFFRYKYFKFSRVQNFVLCRTANPFPSKPLFSLRVCNTSLLKTPVEKGKIARKEPFLRSSPCFLPVGELSAIFMTKQTVVCKKLSFWKSPIFLSFVKGLNLFHTTLFFK